MPSSPLMKYLKDSGSGSGQGSSNGNGHGETHWGRVDVDGFPYRGRDPVMMTEAEADERLVPVRDVKNQVFDTDVPKENAAYLAIMDKIANGWFTLLHRDISKIRVKRRVVTVDPETQEKTVSCYRDVKYKIYLEWYETFMEDGKPMMSQRPYLGRPNP